MRNVQKMKGWGFLTNYREILFHEEILFQFSSFLLIS